MAKKVHLTLFNDTQLRDIMSHGNNLLDAIEIATKDRVMRDLSTEESSIFLRLRAIRSQLQTTLEDIHRGI